MVLALCLVSLAVPTPLSGRDVYVNNVAGDDHQNGNAPESSSPESGPTRTIRRALRLARFGDRVILANTGQPYREFFSLEGPDNSGSAMMPFVLEGNGAVLDGARPVPTDAWQPIDRNVLAFRPPGISYCLLLLDGEPASRQAFANAGQWSLLQPMQWSLVNQRIALRVPDDRLPGDYALSYTALPTGITLYGVRHVVIRNLTIQGFRLDGVNAHDNAFEVQLSGLTCRANGRSGISIGGASRVTVSKCLLEDNGTVQLRTEGWSHAEVNQSQLGDGQQTGWMMEGGQLIVDGTEYQRASHAYAHESAPLHRP
jgi:hypothetical protein